ncbi:hypothetical protein [Microbacterium marinilacus]|uniref:Uncharacterized protein n=1 Tax=Microbacterium marinilacus TaxID=415209 RepID=A0ABP7BDW0_9MICO|nr:hypothetical protein [Microbacterium marinilacus]MBY0689425.1 hypothetical protein [Microbacterium marinilacus]
MRSPLVARRWTGIVLVAVLAAVVGVLAVLALQRGSGDAPAAGPAGTASPPATSADTTPSPTPTRVDVPEPVARDAERLLAAADGVLWRGTAGSCADGVTPVLERSDDDGAAWTDVTPAYRGITQLIALDGFAQDQAQLIATVLDDASDADACDPRAMRTFSDGAFWSDYDDVLAAASYPAPGAAAVTTPSGDVDAPCPEPRSVRSDDGRLALVCDGRALRGDSADWSDAGVPAALAVAPAGDALYVAHVAADCAGVQVSVVSGAGDVTAVACDEEADPASAVALDADADGVWTWAGDEVRRFENAAQ